MSAALLVWDDADGAQSLWPGQRLSMMIDDAGAADQLRRHRRDRTILRACPAEPRPRGK